MEGGGAGFVPGPSRQSQALGASRAELEVHPVSAQHLEEAVHGDVIGVASLRVMY